MKTTIVLVITILGLSAHAASREEIVNMITLKANSIGIDSDLAVAIATVESSLNPKAVGALKEVGLFQLRPEYHDVKIGDPSHNTDVALTYLLYLKGVGENKMGEAWFVLFNYGPNNAPKAPKETKYFKRVMRALSKIKTQRYLAAR